MKNLFALQIVLFLFVTVFVVNGCTTKPQAEKPANNSSEAIAHADNLKTAEEKKTYLCGQAERFLSEKKCEDALNTAQHILTEIDANFQKAKDIVEKAQADLKAAGTEAAEDLKKAADDATKTLDTKGIDTK